MPAGGNPVILKGLHTATVNEEVPFQLPYPCDIIEWKLVVQSINAGTFDLYLQYSDDLGNNYEDFLHFTQVTAAIHLLAVTNVLSAGPFTSACYTSGSLVLAANTSLSIPLDWRYLQYQTVLAGGATSVQWKMSCLLQTMRG